MTPHPVPVLPDGLWGYLFLLAMALLFHEPWRWLGLWLGRGLDIDGPVFAWVRAVATALIAALIMRLTLFPAGALGKLPEGVRVLAFLAGLAVFLLHGRKIHEGVGAGALMLIAGSLLFG